ncbi:Tubulin-specific chaperone C [Folsomia candida]|uniref:Tubulin-specific chaperone C n=1 Tax=Folsomia candida TaxID=158441 RepID=A0A226DC05_FOLCA|nr:Tubulin-specific chaperone C [Folsomia candida]
MGDAPPAASTTHNQSKLSEEFMAIFNKQKNELSVSIDSLSTDSTNANEKLTEILNGIQNLNKILHDASMFLPSYSIKMRQNEIRDLEKSLKNKDDELIPKKRFGFKSKPKEGPVIENSTGATPKSDSLDASIKLIKSTVDSNFITIENLENTTSVLEDDKVSRTDVLLRNLTNVVIYLHGSPSTLRITNIKNCKILCGPVYTSVFVESSVDSVLFLCCQQLRTHSSKNTDIYLRVRSRAIIEECNGIRFGPYIWDHPLSNKLHQATQIDSDLERFDAVDDFNWLSASHSPNWSIVPVEERITFPSL